MNRVAIFILLWIGPILVGQSCGLEDDKTKYDCKCTTNCDKSVQNYSFCEKDISSAQSKAQSNCDAFANSLCTALTGAPRVTCNTADSC